MGHSSYSVSKRSIRAENLAYATASMDTIFSQNQKREIHDSMSPRGITFREARDSESHPNTMPIIIALDVTGSMGRIPHHLVKEGLPHIMETIIQRGIKDPSLLFLAIGDAAIDNYPLQVGQFESGDEELDRWLTRTYVEGGGGSNEGESYHLAWYFAANHTKTDAWEKRKQKGFLFTIGDEPCLNKLTKNQLTEVIGLAAQDGVETETILKQAQERWNVRHLHIMEGNAGQRSLSYWKELLGQDCIQVDDHEMASRVIADIVTDAPKLTVTSSKEEKKDDEMML